jgi:hypothetical protein
VELENLIGVHILLIAVPLGHGVTQLMGPAVNPEQTAAMVTTMQVVLVPEVWAVLILVLAVYMV